MIRNDAHRDEFHRDQQWHKPVRVATTASITIASDLNAGDTIDGVTLAAGDRVLVKNQGTGSQNGIYIAGAVPARAYDMLVGIQALGAVVKVLVGTANGGTYWECTNTTLPTIGTDALTWQAFSGGGGDAHNASAISFDPTGLDHVAAVDVQGAIAELDAAIGTAAPSSLVIDHGNLGSTETFTYAPLGDGVSEGPDHEGVLDDDLTVTFAGAVAGEAAYMTLVLTQDGGGDNSVTWPGSVEWPNGVTPTLDETAGAVEVLSFLTFDGGTTWYGFHGATGSSSGDPADDTSVWMPLSTVVGGDPELVWDGDDSLIPTLTPI